MKVFIFCFLLVFFLYQLLLFVLITLFSLLFSSNWLVKPSRWPKRWQMSPRRLSSHPPLRRGNLLPRLPLPPLRSVQLSSRARWSVLPVNNQVILPPNAPPTVLHPHLLLQRQRQRRSKILIHFCRKYIFRFFILIIFGVYFKQKKGIFSWLRNIF